MDEKEFSSINVIPLVDIMLVLLTIVLTTATFIARGDIPLELPEAKAGNINLDGEPLRITIFKDGRLYIDGREVESSDLSQNLKSLERTKPVKIFADAEVSVQLLIDVLSLLKEMDFRKVSIAVKNEP